MAKVLLIDDDQAILTVFTTALTQAGYQTTTALDGKSGIEKAKAEKPDAILLDQILPDIQGNDVLKALKADESTKKIPIAMLSNFGQTEIVNVAIQNDAQDYILKYQIEPKDLVEKVKTLVGK